MANKVLGVDPVSNEEVQLRNGPFGPYVQLGTGGDKVKPKRQSIPKDTKPEDVGLELALKLLSLPRPIGNHPEDGLPILEFGDIIFGNADNFLRADRSVARVEAVRGGSASTFRS